MIKLSKTWRLIALGGCFMQLLTMPVVVQAQDDGDEDDDYVNEFLNNENESNKNANKNANANANANLNSNQNAANQQENNEENFQQGNNGNNANKAKNNGAGKNNAANGNNGNLINNNNNNANTNLNNNFNANSNQVQVNAQDIPNADFEQGNFSLGNQSQGQGNPGAQGQNGFGSGTFGNEPAGNPANQGAGPIEANPTDPATDATIAAPGEDEPVKLLPDSEQGPVVPGVNDPNEFAGAPPIFGTRRIMAQGEAPEEYAVEPGDTLYDICDQLVDEPDYWPKLWALNPDIKNPHFIYPGVKLTFYPGDTETPPFLQLVTENDVVPVDKAQIRAEELLQRQDITNLLLNIAKNGPTPIIRPDELTGAEGVETQLMTVGGTIRPDKVIVTVPAFLFESRRDPIGVVVGGVAGSMLTDKNDEIIIRNENNLSTGTTYTVLRETESVYNVETNSFVGKRYEFVAHIRVTERANGDGLFLGKVTENRLGIQPGDYVMPYKSTTRIVATGGVPPPSGGSGNVVLGFENPEMVVGGQGSLVLIDTKEKQISVGQTVAIYQNINRSASPFIKDQLPDVARNVGIVRIIDNTGVGAVGYVLSVRREIRVGDRAGKG